jgi:hypothetical protein
MKLKDQRGEPAKRHTRGEQMAQHDSLPHDSFAERVRTRAYEMWELAGRPHCDGAGFWLAAEAELRYLLEVAALPLPTVKQTAAFAEYVAGARSWYKHVPRLDPRSRVVAFLDPNAGAVSGTVEGQEHIRAIYDASECWHYSQMPTQEYQQRFGHWTFWVIRPNTDDPARVRASDGTWLAVPPEVWHRSGCPVFMLFSPGELESAFSAGRRWFASACLGLRPLVD